MEGSRIRRVVTWLRAGYPQGVPREDYLAVFGVLHRSLTETEIEQIALELHERSGSDVISEAEIKDLIHKRVLQDPTDVDIRRVAGRLAEGGWPLEAISTLLVPARRPILPRIERMISWLRQGYPTGIPDAEFIPVLAVLKRRLSEEELDELAEDMQEAGFIPADRLAVAAAYLRITDELADEAQLSKVLDRLRDAGIEVDDLDRDSTDSAST